MQGRKKYLDIYTGDTNIRGSPNPWVTSTKTAASCILLFQETELQSATFIVAIFPHNVFLPERKLLQSMKLF